MAGHTGPVGLGRPLCAPHLCAPVFWVVNGHSRPGPAPRPASALLSGCSKKLYLLHTLLEGVRSVTGKEKGPVTDQLPALATPFTGTTSFPRVLSVLTRTDRTV